MSKGKLLITALLIGFRSTLIAQSLPVANVSSNPSQPKNVTVHMSGDNSNYFCEIMELIQWEQQLDALVQEIFLHHYTKKSESDIKTMILDGMLNSFEYYPRIDSDQKRKLKQRFQSFFSPSSNLVSFGENVFIEKLDGYSPIIKSGDRSKIQIDKGFLDWVKTKIFKHNDTQDVFNNVPNNYKYAALFQGIAKTLDPNSWFSYDAQSYRRSCQLVEKYQNNEIDNPVIAVEGSKAQNQAYAFGTFKLENSILTVKFKKDLGYYAGRSLQQVLYQYRNSFDSVLYDFSGTLGGLSQVFEHLLEPFLAKPDKDFLLASFFDRNGFEVFEKRMVISSLTNEERLWKHDILDKILNVKISPISSSGAEITAMAVKDYGLGIVFGQRSSGKMTAAKPFMVGPFPFWLTRYKFFGPRGESPKGVEPDIKLFLEDENNYLRNYEKSFAINYPKKLREVQLAGVYADSKLIPLNSKQKKTQVQQIIHDSFLRDKKFRAIIKDKSEPQNSLVHFIIKTITKNCGRNQLSFECDIETMNTDIEDFVEYSF